MTCEECGKQGQEAITRRVYKLQIKNVCRLCAIEYDNRNCTCFECRLDFGYQQAVLHSDLDGVIRWETLFSLLTAAGAMSATIMRIPEQAFDDAFAHYAAEKDESGGARAELMRRWKSLREQMFITQKIDNRERRAAKQKA